MKVYKYLIVSAHMWALDQQNIERTSIWAFKHPSTHIHLAVQSAYDWRTIIKVSEYVSILLHDRFNLQAYRYIVIQVCAHVVKK